jgi:hypothetical protein
MKKEVLKKIPVIGNRQLWILVGKNHDAVTVEFRVHHLGRDGSALPTRHGFEIPLNRIVDLQKSLSELIEIARNAAHSRGQPLK